MNPHIEEGDIIVFDHITIPGWAAPHCSEMFVRKSIRVKVLDPEYYPMAEDRKAIHAKAEGHPRMYFLYDKVEYRVVERQDGGHLTATVTIT